MKIEKLNENQIRCTLNSEDLSEREIKMSEFIHGSDSARQLLQDAIQQAYEEYGFDVKDQAVMIDVVPVSPGQLIIILTKAESEEDVEEHISNMRNGMSPVTKPAEPEEKVIENPTAYAVCFASLSDAIEFAHIVSPLYGGKSSLYKADGTYPYKLVMNIQKEDKLYAIAEEYAHLEPISAPMEAHFVEHLEAISKDKALKVLSSL